jgi:hypothetical protein
VARALEANPLVKKWTFVTAFQTLALETHIEPGNLPPDSIIVTPAKSA